MTIEVIILLVALTTSIFVIIILLNRWSLHKQRVEQQRVEQRLADSRRVERLLRDGVQTVEDYFWLFPGACRVCGSRTWTEVEICELRGSTPGLSPDAMVWKEFVCNRCPLPPSDASERYVSNTGESRTLSSPWLTPEQAGKIPQIRPQQMGT
jgi:hypothetical protein